MFGFCDADSKGTGYETATDGRTIYDTAEEQASLDDTLTENQLDEEKRPKAAASQGEHQEKQVNVLNQPSKEFG